jgi:periplasmic divalent cation tolerance protein
VVPGLRSIYRWQGEVRSDSEVLLLLKTPASRLPLLMDRFPELHPYDVPELLALPVASGFEAYCHWVVAETDNRSP